MSEINLTGLHRIVLTAVIYDSEGRFLITKRSETKKVHPGKWTIPGGGLETSDYLNSPKDQANGWASVLEKALLRELAEEVGVEVGEPHLFSHMAFIRPDDIPVLVLSYYARYLGGEVHLDEDATEYAWIGASEIDKYDIIDGVKFDLRKAAELLSSS